MWHVYDETTNHTFDISFSQRPFNLKVQQIDPYLESAIQK